MGILRRVKDILAANLNDLIDQAEDPLLTARQVIRELDDEIVALRGKMRLEDARVEQARSRLARKQAEIVAWQERAERANDEGKAPIARAALERKRAMEQEAKDLEAAWWEVAQEHQAQEQRMRELEGRAQEARRKKEALVARARTGRSSSDFIPVAAMQAADDTGKSTEAVAIEAELERIKKRKSETA